MRPTTDKPDGNFEAALSQNKTPPAPPASGSNAVPPKKCCDLFGKSVFAAREEAQNGFVEEKT